MFEALVKNTLNNSGNRGHSVNIPYYLLYFAVMTFRLQVGLFISNLKEWKATHSQVFDIAG